MIKHIPDMFTCERYTLNNGLQVVLSPQKHTGVMTSILIYHVGLRQELVGQHGMSHFVEHMMFKGTTRHGKGEIDRLSLQCGGSNNAYTSLDTTVYTTSFPTEHCETVLDIEADRMQNTLFLPSDVESEREVILEEWKTAEDDPDDAFWQNFSQNIMGAHAYGRPVLGYKESIRGFTPEGLKAFFHQHYHPQNATLILVGGLPAQVKTQIRQHFEDLPEKPILSPKPIEFSLSPQRLTTRHKDVNTCRGIFCWPAPAFGSADYFAFLVLQYVLTEGWSSLLHALWVEQEKWVTQVSCSIFESQDPYIFWLEVDCDSASASLEKQLMESFYALSIDSHDVEKAKRQRITDLFLQQETTEQRADFIAECLSAGNFTDFVEYFDRLQAVNVEAVQGLFHRYLQPEKQSTGWLVPEDADDSL